MRRPPSTETDPALRSHLRGLLAGGAVLADIVPGVTVRGEDVGRWLERQHEHAVWVKLLPEQQETLTRRPRRADTITEGFEITARKTINA